MSKPPAARVAQRAIRLWLPVVLCSLSTVAGAETSPYYIGLSQSFGYDSNVFRQVSRFAQSSGTISSTSLLGGFDQHIGRQRVYADASASYNSYSSLSRLDYSGYGLEGGLDWETVERLSGTVKLGARETLASYADRNGLGQLQKNVENSNYIDLVARLGSPEQSVSWLEAGAGWNEFKYSVPEDDRARDAAYVTFGARYRASGRLVVGAGLRSERGSYNFTGGSDYTRQDIDLLARWTPSGASTVLARLSFGNSNYQDPTDVRSDNADVTGALGWEWQPTAKIHSEARLIYDTEDRTHSGSLPSDTFSSGEKATTLDWTGTYEATAKILATVRYSYAYRDLEKRSDAGHDTTQTFNVGLSYLPTRNTELGCSLGAENRASSSTRVSIPYSANTGNCYGRIYLR